MCTFPVLYIKYLTACLAEKKSQKIRQYGNESRNNLKQNIYKEAQKSDDKELATQKQGHGVENKRSETDQELRSSRVAQKQERSQQNKIAKEGEFAIMEPLCQHGNDNSVVTRGELKGINIYIINYK